MRIGIICFTSQGQKLANKIKDVLPGYETELCMGPGEDAKAFVKEYFAAGRAIIFIGACGIAVRMIAPYVKDKLSDSPVIVIDELGRHVVPILSGHVGGANELSLEIADKLDADPVITTATDLNGKFAADIFAKENSLRIINKDGIKKVSSKALRGDVIRVSYPPCEDVDIVISSDAEKFSDRASLMLKPKEYVLGIGCKKGKSAGEIGDFVEEELKKLGIAAEDVAAVASIDVKKDEPGIRGLADKYRVPFLTYTEEELGKAKGSFSGSDFVEKTVGVDNVCERAAYLASDCGEIVLRKQAKDGKTLAVAKKKKKNIIYVVGIGPGRRDMLTPEAESVIARSDTVIGYPVYLELLGDLIKDKEILSTPMRKEVERCRMAYENTLLGKLTTLVCSGDAGIYGMASLMYELLPEYPGCDVRVIPGITAANSGAAVLGAPINHDFCVISLSDLLTPWERIEERLIAATKADFAIVLYNPSSNKRPDYLKRACEIILRYADSKRPCGYVENIGRDGETPHVCTLGELAGQKVNMFTTVFIGNSQSYIENGKLITKRGYTV